MSNPVHNVKSRVAAISVFASAGMAAAKFVVGIAIGSLALISEALHSSIDVVATVITWMVVRVSDLPADEEHHYGHGMLESISALVGSAWRAPRWRPCWIASRRAAPRKQEPQAGRCPAYSISNACV